MLAKISPMGLGRSDVAILRGEMARLHGRFLAQGEPPAASGARLEAIEIRRGFAMDAYTRLLEILSPDGRAKLVAQIARVKTHTKAIGRAR